MQDVAAQRSEAGDKRGPCSANAAPIGVEQVSICACSAPLRLCVEQLEPHRGRASIITVEPAPHAASATANGSDATTSAKYDEVLRQPRSARFRDPPHAPRHRVERRRQAARQPGGIVAQRKIFAAQHLEARALDHLLQIAAAEIGQVARDVGAVPRAAQQARLPGRGVRHLHHQAAVRRQQFVRRRAGTRADRRGAPSRGTS